MGPLKKLIEFLRDRDDGLKRRTLRAGIWVGVSSIFLNMLSLLRSVVLARLLTPEIFGLWAVCTTLVRAIKVFTETGFTSALIQRQDRAEEARDTAFTLLILRGAVITLITIAAAPLFAGFYEQPILQSLVSVLAIAFLITGFHNINTVFYEKELKFRRLVYLEQIATVLGFIFVVVVAYIYRSAWALVAAHLFTVAVTVILSYLMIPAKPRFAIDKKIALELFHYGKFVSGAAMVIFITFEIDNLIIGKIIGMEGLGFYSVAFMLANLPATHLAKVVSGVMLPAYSKLQSDYSTLRSAYLRTLEFVAALTIPASIGVGLLAPQILGVIFGERWLPAVDALRVLAVFGCLRAIASLNGYLYNAIGKPKNTFYINLSKLFVIALLIYPLTTRYGIVGAAIAVTTPSILTFIADFVLLRRTIGLPLRSVITTLSRTLSFSLVMAAVLILIQPYLGGLNLLSLTSSIIIGFLVYILMAGRNLLQIYTWIRAKR